MGHVIVNASTVTKLRPVVTFEQDQDGTACGISLLLRTNEFKFSMSDRNRDVQVHILQYTVHILQYTVIHKQINF